MWKLCTIGEALIDFVPMEAGKRLKDVVCFRRVAGGAPANVAYAYAHLGGRAKLITKLGRDAFGDHIVDTLQKGHVDVSSIVRTSHYDTALAFVSLSADGSRDFQFYRRTSADLQLGYEELDETAKDFDVLHFCSVALQKDPMRECHRRLIEAARRKQKLICFDPNLRFSLWEEEQALKEQVRAFLPYADIVKIADDELSFISGRETIEAALPFFFAFPHCQMVLYTKGGKGAELFTRTRHVKVDGCAVDVLDTTGAGDGFVAAFLYRLGEKTKPLDALDERDLEDALRFANTFAALSARHLGAMDAYPSLAEVEAYSMKRSASNL